MLKSLSWRCNLLSADHLSATSNLASMGSVKSLRRGSVSLKSGGMHCDLTTLAIWSIMPSTTATLMDVTHLLSEKRSHRTSITRISGSQVCMELYMPSGRQIGMTRGTACPSKASSKKMQSCRSKSPTTQQRGCSQFRGLLKLQASLTKYADTNWPMPSDSTTSGDHSRTMPWGGRLPSPPCPSPSPPSPEVLAPPPPSLGGLAPALARGPISASGALNRRRGCQPPLTGRSGEPLFDDEPGEELERNKHIGDGDANAPGRGSSVGSCGDDAAEGAGERNEELRGGVDDQPPRLPIVNTLFGEMVGSGSSTGPWTGALAQGSAAPPRTVRKSGTTGSAIHAQLAAFARFRAGARPRFVRRDATPTPAMQPAKQATSPRCKPRAEPTREKQETTAATSGTPMPEGSLGRLSGIRQLSGFMGNASCRTPTSPTESCKACARLAPGDSLGGGWKGRGGMSTAKARRTRRVNLDSARKSYMAQFASSMPKPQYSGTCSANQATDLKSTSLALATFWSCTEPWNQEGLEVLELLWPLSTLGTDCELTERTGAEARRRRRNFGHFRGSPCRLKSEKWMPTSMSPALRE
mmetsp:Transcript_117105/g.372916  ORF Transcript_117105/g.372916 Transcript_117105/m.372916 type:complete len:582 (-) Transcript_117105:917-2662(-)